MLIAINFSNKRHSFHFEREKLTNFYGLHNIVIVIIKL